AGSVLAHQDGDAGRVHGQVASPQGFGGAGGVAETDSGQAYLGRHGFLQSGTPFRMLKSSVPSASGNRYKNRLRRSRRKPWADAFHAAPPPFLYFRRFSREPLRIMQPIQDIRARLNADLNALESQLAAGGKGLAKAFEDVKVKYQGKKGDISGLLRSMGA